ncbi:MAG TPA: hypothetical protein VGJ20_44120 [Xanthobacteraceae bacterium]
MMVTERVGDQFPERQGDACSRHDFVDPERLRAEPMKPESQRQRKNQCKINQGYRLRAALLEEREQPAFIGERNVRMGVQHGGEECCT